jgi:hypothetical protein
MSLLSVQTLPEVIEIFTWANVIKLSAAPLWGRLLGFPTYGTRLERLARDKNSSLLQTFVNYVL